MRISRVTAEDIAENWTELESLNQFHLLKSLAESLPVALISGLTTIQGFTQYLRETLQDDAEKFHRILMDCATLVNLIPEVKRVWLNMGNHPTVAKVAVEEWVNLLHQVMNCFSSVDVILREISEEIRRQYAEAFLIMTTDVNNCLRLLQVYDDFCTEILGSLNETTYRDRHARTQRRQNT